LPLAVNVAAVMSSEFNVPPTVTLPNDTLSEVPTACPIANVTACPVAEVVTPVPPVKAID